MGAELLLTPKISARSPLIRITFCLQRHHMLSPSALTRSGYRSDGWLFSVQFSPLGMWCPFLTWRTYWPDGVALLAGCVPRLRACGVRRWQHALAFHCNGKHKLGGKCMTALLGLSDKHVLRENKYVWNSWRNITSDDFDHSDKQNWRSRMCVNGDSWSSFQMSVEMVQILLICDKASV